MKAIPEQINELIKGLNIGKGLENYLIMAVVNEANRDVIESMLIKYEMLDDALEKQLDQGKGAMVIEG